MPNADKVESLIRTFANDLQAAIREQLSIEVTSAVQAALGGGSVGLRSGRRGSARSGGAPALGAKANTGGKRTPEQIEKLGIQLLAYISKNPEQRSEQIAEGVKLSTSELALPLKRLVEEKKLKAKGKARGTTYTAVG